MSLQHRLPHRLELAVKAAIKENSTIGKIDEALSALTNYYGTYKRKARLRQCAVKGVLDIYELHSVFKQRWVSLDFVAVGAIVKSWRLLVTDLQRVGDL